MRHNLAIVAIVVVLALVSSSACTQEFATPASPSPYVAVSAPTTAGPVLTASPGVCPLPGCQPWVVWQASATTPRAELYRDDQIVSTRTSGVLYDMPLATGTHTYSLFEEVQGQMKAVVSATVVVH